MEPINNGYGEFEQTAKLKVIGVGGGGGNAVNRMVEADLQGAEFVAINTDSQVLKKSYAKIRIQIGKSLTKGLGAGADPDVGKQAALEDIEDIENVCAGADLIFVTAGMGGGTGTGAAPIVAKCAKEAGAIVVAIVTKPFEFEGPRRMQQALKGIEELRPYVDTLIIIPNDKILEVCGPDTTYIEAFNKADEVLRRGVQGITEIIQLPGLVNVDFADVRATLKNCGTALMGIGISSSPNRAIDAVHDAIKATLCEEDISDATDAIVQITSNREITMGEVRAILNEIRAASTPDINIIYGSGFNLDLDQEIIVYVIASGFGKNKKEHTIAEVPTGTNPEEPKKENKEESSSKVPSWLRNRYK